MDLRGVGRGGKCEQNMLYYILKELIKNKETQQAAAAEHLLSRLSCSSL